MLRTTVAVLAGALFVIPSTASASKPTGEFQQTRWGMTEKQVRKLYPDLKPFESKTPGLTIFDSDGVEVLNEKVGAGFFFMGGKLVRVNMLLAKYNPTTAEESLNPNMDKVREAAAMFLKVLDGLRIKYGDPHQELEHLSVADPSDVVALADGVAKNGTVHEKWVLPKARINLDLNGIAGSAFVTLEYVDAGYAKERDAAAAAAASKGL